MAAERILVCDDDPQIRRALSLILREAGYEVLIASTAEQALDRAAVSGPHLAIVDLLLPDQPGIELCRRLREWSQMPILVLSAVGDEQTKIDALHHGADDYVTKPFGPGELVARVRAALRRAGRDASEPRIEVGTLVVDLAAHSVSVNGADVHLTPTEFSLLRVLVLNRGLLITHRQLLTEVWGPEYADATPVLRTHIANLRGKLQAGEEDRRLIRTDSGIGYRFSG
ncbi:MAG TPA: response regulator transcription factor [Solirubrobacteraceae bacterium]|jgi:two-component system KDP operon response regulator KdpE|nr:response regulator transcription factor [Solirubrobacteraceae bacterium]